MNTQILFNLLLIFATLSTMLVAGLTLTFAIVIMPGLAKLGDGAFIRAFQVIDGIIQDGQPVFGLVWVGSILSLTAASILGLWHLDGPLKWLLLAAGIFYVAGVQVPTLRGNVPLNNALQRVEVFNATDESLRCARKAFEKKWNRFNGLRTVVVILVSVMLLLVLLLL